VAHAWVMDRCGVGGSVGAIGASSGRVSWWGVLLDDLGLPSKGEQTSESKPARPAAMFSRDGESPAVASI
jgi:hypothetical protein